MGVIKMKIKFTIPYIISGAAMFFGGSMSSAAANENDRDNNDNHNKMENLYANVKINMPNVTIPNTFGPKPADVREEGKSVIVIMSNGDEIHRRGGTRAWRNNNPGNIVYGQFARENGAIGKGGRFAVFPDEETGRMAVANLLRSPRYNNLTISAAINRYAPPHENNTTRYKRQLSEITGLSIHTKLRDLSDKQIMAVVDAITEIEGWRAGTEEIRMMARANVFHSGIEKVAGEIPESDFQITPEIINSTVQKDM